MLRRLHARTAPVRAGAVRLGCSGLRKTRSAQHDTASQDGSLTTVIVRDLRPGSVDEDTCLPRLFAA